LFSENLLEENEYNSGLKTYIEDTLGLKNYSITEEERGKIPMTNSRFPKGEHKLIQLGTAGGQTKGSTGYTFRFIQKHSASIVKDLQKGRLRPSSTNLKFRFYDSVLLDVLKNNRMEGHQVFTDIFQASDPSRVLRFLDNESSLIDDLQIIRSLPTTPFLKAAMNQLAQNF
jgi:lycopene beta-cyclase